MTVWHVQVCVTTRPEHLVVGLVWGPAGVTDHPPFWSQGQCHSAGTGASLEEVQCTERKRTLSAARRAHGSVGTKAGAARFHSWRLRTGPEACAARLCGARPYVCPLSPGPGDGVRDGGFGTHI